MVRPDQMTGEASTFATLDVWDEAEFTYRIIHECSRFQDARDHYVALHQPPLIIVVNIRYDRQVIRP
jgi:hypothetical protein